MEATNLRTIANYADGILRQGDPSCRVVGITTDSRKDTRGEIFIAIKGDNFDGHRFVADSAARGTVGAIVERGYRAPSLPADYALVEVDDTIRAYQRIAASYRLTLSAQIIAITGSNGKTSTKDFTSAVLAKKYCVIKTDGNLNNHIGVPQTLLRASDTDQIVVLEMGMNHPGEIAPLVGIARPNVGIITNIGTAHIEYMGTRSAIAQEKGMLAEMIGLDGRVILSAQDEFSNSIAMRTSAQVIMVGADDSVIRAEDIKLGATGNQFTLVVDGMHASAWIPVPGRHMVINALFAIAAGRHYKVPLEECVAALSEVQLTKGRMELKNVKGIQFLDDSYNANPDSMVAALETLARLPDAHRRIAVLGKMGELGEAAQAGYHRVGITAAQEKIDQLIVVGSEAQEIAKSARDAGLQAVTTVDGAEQAADLLRANTKCGDLVLLKGSRSAAIEQVLLYFNPSRPHRASPLNTSASAVPSNTP